MRPMSALPHRVLLVSLALGLSFGAPLAADSGPAKTPPPDAGDLAVLDVKAYWLDPARRQQTIDTLGAYGASFGCLLTLFLAGVHHVVVEANRSTPAALPAGLFFALLGAFGLALVAWIASLARRFRRRD